jgi:hypothetical protein
MWYLNKGAVGGSGASPLSIISAASLKLETAVPYSNDLISSTAALYSLAKTIGYAPSAMASSVDMLNPSAVER